MFGESCCILNKKISLIRKIHRLFEYIYVYIYIMLRHLLILHLSHAIYLLIFLICNIIIYIYHLY